LRSYNKLIKDYSKAHGKSRHQISQQIALLKDSLKETFKRPRPTKDSKAKLTPLEKQFEELNRQYKSVPGTEEELKASDYSSNPEENLEDFGIMEKDSLAYHDSVQLKNEELRERKERVDELHKDLHTVNEMFKDAALMIKEQGEDLTVVEKHVDTAAQETGRGVRELTKAEGYQRSAKKKMCIIFVIAAIVVGVLLAVVFGVVVF
jgi:uncharacterized protein (DUF3084 family)